MRVIECEAGRDVTELALGFLAAHGFDPAQAARPRPLRPLQRGDARQHPSRDRDPRARRTHRGPTPQAHRAVLTSPRPLPPHRRVGCLPHRLRISEAYLTRGLDAIIAGVRAQAPSGHSLGA